MIGKYRWQLSCARELYRAKWIRGYATKSKPSSEWRSAIGLEVHAQISTESKLFSSGSSKYGLPTNSTVNLFDAAVPGTLPVLNKKAVELAVSTSLALKCNINAVSCFDRKHYFYSDLPNGYQITQQRFPLADNGVIDFTVFEPNVHPKPYRKSSRIKQIQLEQDSGRSYHEFESGATLVDLNRAGIALMEIVFEPDLEDGEEAAALINELVAILGRVGSCSCKMEEGAIRVDVNVSVRREGEELGVRTEIKNVGSVRGVVNAIKYETARQAAVLASGGLVANQTFAWNPSSDKTILMRDKEDREDYRFMPEPNLPPLRVSLRDDSNGLRHDAAAAAAKNGDFILDLRHLPREIPVLPQDERNLLVDKYKTSELIAFEIVNKPPLYKYFTDIMAEDGSRNVKTVFNVLMTGLLTSLNKLEMDLGECNVPSACLGKLVDLRQANRITKTAMEIVLEEVLAGRASSPESIVRDKQLYVMSEEEMTELCLGVVEDNPKAVRDYHRGKKKVLNFFLREVMAKANARAAKNSILAITERILEDMRKSRQ